ncbi:MAG: 4-(cytidine 5'-diphospho)-2-C-methyl-D-erythritol kinase [Bacteroidales bacterium]
MIIHSKAKINLGLQVIRKRTDGFHELRTVFYPINLCDTIEIKPSSSFSYKDIGLRIDCRVENNLIYKAYNILSEKYTFPQSVSVTMDKLIPFGAGLGGGSSNASSILQALNEMFELRLSKQQLYEYASQLGSDCPFFILSKACIATGRGELLTPIDFSLSGYYLTIVKSEDTVSTAEAYGGIRPAPRNTSLTDIIKLPIEQWKGVLKNDFEEHIFQAKPRIAEVKDKLYELGAIYASMSGSGAAVYGIFKTMQGNIRDEFPKSYFVWSGECI